MQVNKKKLSTFFMSLLLLTSTFATNVSALEETVTPVIEETKEIVESTAEKTVDTKEVETEAPLPTETVIITDEAGPEKVIVEEVKEDVKVFKTQFGTNSTGKESDLDFSSKRLIVGTDNRAVFTHDTEIVSDFNGMYILQFETETETKHAYLFYEDKVEFIEPDVTVSIATDENSGTVVENNPLEKLEEALNSVQAVHEKETVIAVLDTGMDEHTNVVEHISFFDGATNDDNGHGNLMLNHILSENSKAKVISIKVLNHEGKGNISTVIAGMKYAIEKKVDMINLSLVAPNTVDNSLLKEVVEEAVDKGIIVVVAAGNNNKNAKYYTPANIDKALVVGAILENGDKLANANYGKVVDFNVIANSTSEATAKMSGIISYHLNHNISDFSGNRNVVKNRFLGNGETEDIPPVYNFEGVQSAAPMLTGLDSLKGQGKTIGDFIKLGEGVDPVNDKVYFYAVNVAKDQPFTNDNLVFNPKADGLSQPAAWNGEAGNPYWSEGRGVNQTRKAYNAVSIGNNDRLVTWAPNAGTYRGQPFGAKITYTRHDKGDVNNISDKRLFEIAHGQFNGIWSVWTEAAKIMQVDVELFSNVPAGADKPAGTPITMTTSSDFIFWGGAGLTNEVGNGPDGIYKNSIETLVMPTSSDVQLYTPDNVSKYSADVNHVPGYTMFGYNQFNTNATLYVNTVNKEKATFYTGILGSLNPDKQYWRDYQGSGDSSMHWAIVVNPQNITGFNRNDGIPKDPTIQKAIVVTEGDQEFTYTERYKHTTEDITDNVRYKLSVTVYDKADLGGHKALKVTDTLDSIIALKGTVEDIRVKLGADDVTDKFDIQYDVAKQKLDVTFKNKDANSILDEYYGNTYDIYVPIVKPLFSAMSDAQKEIWKTRETFEIPNTAQLSIVNMKLTDGTLVPDGPKKVNSNEVIIQTPNKLTIKYIDKETGEEVTNPFVDNSKRGGDNFTVTYPNVPGYKIDPDNVDRGTMPNDVHEHIVYFKQSRLIINYLEEGTNIVLHSRHVDLTKAKGDKYNVPSPNIDGYKLVNSADKDVIGTMPSDKHEIDVFYNKKPQVGSQVTTYKSANPVSLTIVQKGQEIEYTLTVKNTGIKAEEVVNVWDGIPAGTTYVDGSADSNGTFNADKNRVEWTLNNVTPGSSTELKFKVTVNQDNESAIYNSGNWNTGNDPEPRETNVTVHPMKDEEKGPALLNAIKGGNSDTIERVWVPGDDTGLTKHTFNYTGREETFVAPYTGYYIMDIAGASGSNDRDLGQNSGYLGGASGMYRTKVQLTKGTTYYINVGGHSGSAEPGYNGGGRGDNDQSGGGGGATSIATVSNIITQIENNQDSIVAIVGGGGGGSGREAHNANEGSHNVNTVGYGRGQNTSTTGGGGGGGFFAGNAGARELSGGAGTSKFSSTLTSETEKASQHRGNGSLVITELRRVSNQPVMANGNIDDNNPRIVPETGEYIAYLRGTDGGGPVWKQNEKGHQGDSFTVNLQLEKDQQIYLKVGRTGFPGSNGGNWSSGCGRCHFNGGGHGTGEYAAGGDASHIAFVPGRLQDLAGQREQIIAVAGGGAGINQAYPNDFTGRAGFQSEGNNRVGGNTFGKGADATRTHGGGGSGIEGGLAGYGGKSYYNPVYASNYTPIPNGHPLYKEAWYAGTIEIYKMEQLDGIGRWEYRNKPANAAANGVIEVDENNDTTITYFITITNSGNAVSKDTVITDNIPVGTTYVPDSAKRVNPDNTTEVISDGTYNQAKNRVEFYLGNLNTGDRATISFKVKPTGDVAIIQNGAKYGNNIPEGDVPNSNPPHQTNIVEHRIPNKISVVKEWRNDAPEFRPASIIVHLVGSNGQEYTAELNAENNWKHTFKNVPFGETAPGVTYTLYEDEVVGYESNAKQAQPIQVGETGLVNVTNTRLVHKITTEVVNGTISGNMLDIPSGEDRETTYNPNEGHYLSHIEIDGERIPETDLANVLANYPFRNVRKDYHIRVVYLPYYKITTEVVNGHIDPNITNIKEHEDREVNYGPNPNHVLDYIEVDGRVVPNPKDFLEKTPFNDVTSDHHIKVVYSPAPPIVKNSVTNENLVKEADRPQGVAYNVPNELYNSKVHFKDGVGTYNISITNTLSEDQIFTVFDRLPEGMTYISSSDDGVYTEATRRIEWADVRINAGKTKVITVTVEFTTTGNLVNTAGYTLNGFTSEPVERPTRIVPKPVKSVSTLDGQEDLHNKLVGVNEEVLYKVSWTNTTDEPVEYTLKDILSDELTLVEVRDNGTSAVENDKTVLTWTGTAQANATVDVHFVAKVTKASKVVDNEAYLQADHLLIASNKVTVSTPTPPSKRIMSGLHNIDNRWLDKGVEATYVIKVTNDTDLETTAQITDSIHEDLEILEVSDNGTVTGQDIVWNVTVQPKDIKEVTVRFRVKDSVLGKVVENTANVTIGRIPPTPTNTTVNPTPTPPVKAVFEGKRDVHTKLVQSGNTVTYKLTVVNTSNKPATMELTDVLDENLEFLTVLDNVEHTYDTDTRTLVMTREFEAEETYVFEFTAKAIKQDVRIDNKATLRIIPKIDYQDPYEGTPNRPNPKPFDGVDLPPIDTNTVTIYTPKDPIKKVLNKELADINNQYVKDGDILTYELTVKNSLEETATMTVTDKLPVGTIFVSATDNGVYDKDTNTVTWTFDLTAGSTKAVKFDVEVVTEKDVDGNIIAGKVKNQGTQIYNDYDTELRTNPVENPKLQPTKDVFRTSQPTISINGEKVKLNEELLYTIHIFNSKDEAVVVKVEDALDERLQFISASDNGKVITEEIEVADNNPIVVPVNGGEVVNKPAEKVVKNTLVWEELTLQPGEVKVLSYVVKVAKWKDGSVLNEATLTDIENNYKSTTKLVENPLTKDPFKQVLNNNGKDIHTETVQSGDTLNYVITIYNDEKAGRTARIFDRIPVGTSFLSAENNGKLVNGEVQWEVVVPAQSTQVVRFKVKVENWKQDIIENIAEVQWSILPEPNVPGQPPVVPGDPGNPPVVPGNPDNPGQPPVDPNVPNVPDVPKTPEFGPRQSTNKVYNKINKPPVPMIQVETGIEDSEIIVPFAIGSGLALVGIALYISTKRKKDKKEA